jgi:phosphoribosylaminoimidazolecarboxamide formyltransferase/IMP cyclohydrolase
MSHAIAIKRALISVSDKTGVVELAQALQKWGCEILSTGGTLEILQKSGVTVKSVSDFTGQSEILSGRVKTLHPKIHGGILAIRTDSGHQKQMKENNILPIDLVVVNLYPFQKTVAKENVLLEEAIENIDIGGPAMIRSAAKNHESVAVVVDPADYTPLIDLLNQNKGSLDLHTRQRLALKAFEQTSQYDSAISGFLAGRFNEPGALPQMISKNWQKQADLRYGENPHQKAAFFNESGRAQIKIKQLHGKELSYNNLLDIDAVLSILIEFSKPCACVVKHNNPSGIAVHAKIHTAALQAIQCDPLSAFGGIVGLNRKCDEKSARTILKQLTFFEVLIAPSFDAKALSILKARKNLRIMQVDLEAFSKEQGLELRPVFNGVLIQEKDPVIEASEEKEIIKNEKIVTRKKLTHSELDSLLFAWKCAKVVRSNAIVLAQGTHTVGIGAGQMSRVDSVRIACEKAGKKRTKGAALASDGFFPMPDNIEIAHQWKIASLIQPGGSVKDEEVIRACDKYKIAMLFTGKRHFKH